MMNLDAVSRAVTKSEHAQLTSNVTALLAHIRFSTTTEFAGYFFFSRTRRHTSSTRDWSSDVCSSDLMPHLRLYEIVRIDPALDEHAFGAVGMRSEGRRVGKECRSRWSPYH